jgi:uncharacterized membrane protein (DUF2068 family)
MSHALWPADAAPSTSPVGRATATLAGRETRRSVRRHRRESTIATVRRERGLVVIIAYKLIKGGLWFILATTILVMMRMGLGHRLLGLADHLRLHAHVWSLRLADLLVRASSRRALWTIVVALVADGSLTLFEAWALIHGRWWGPWLVVVATAALLPFEVVALVHHPHAIRALVLLVNLAIVGYLGRKALREERVRRSERRDRVSAATPRGALPPA